jgi:two-component system sensor histidine kinase AlgZ
MHPILADWRRLGAYFAAWVLVGLLIALQLVLASPFSWVEAFVFAVPLALVLGSMGLAAFWVCRAAPLALPGLARSLGTQLLAAVLSSALWLAVGRAWAVLLDRLDVFPGLPGRLPQVAPALLGLGATLFLLTAALHYLLGAVAASQEAERRALELRAQIHPHFLFNSLNSINALIAARPDEARRLCVRLGDFLRRSLLVGSRETIPLAEELDLAEQLLSIERVRFGERLSHEIRAGDDARACPVPPLVLQPLVENAVTHGVAQLIEGGRIRITAERRGDHLVVRVENPRDPDSPGRGGAGIGLQNVRRRLAALHGEDADVRIVPSADAFRVELRMPVPPETSVSAPAPATAR